MRHSRHIAAALLAAGVVAATGGVAVADHHSRDRHSANARVFTLAPDPAANPEGVAFSKRLDAFFVSDTGDGTIYRGRTDRRTVSPFIPGAAGQSAVGLKVAGRRLYVAGGSTGTIAVYDLGSKQRVASFDTGPGGFLNDLVVTRRGDVYVTDSTRPVLWHVTAAQVAAGSGTPQRLDVSSGIAFASGFNLNGIVADGARRLVVVQTNTGKLFRIALSRDGAAIRAIDAVSGVSVPGGDGMLLDGGRLLVVQGGPPAQISSVKLRHGDLSGQVRDVRTSGKLHGPSTIARARDLYLVVNADFANSAKPFTVAGLPRRGVDNPVDDRDHENNHDRGHDHGDDRGHDHGVGNSGDDGPGHDQGDDNGAASATPTPGGGDDNGHGNGGQPPYYGTPTPTPTPYYGAAGGGDDDGHGGSGGGGGNGGGSGGGGGGQPPYSGGGGDG